MIKKLFTVLVSLFFLFPPLALTAESKDSRSALLSLQNAFCDVAEKVLPVVVEVKVVDIVQQSTMNPFSFFYGQNSEGPQTREYRQEGLGSGVIVERRNDTVYVLTNNHVIANADEVSILLYDDREFSEVTIVGSDPNLDLALLSFKTDEEVPIATLGDSDALRIGDWALAVGNPFGFESTVTAGIISAKGRTTNTQNSLFTDYLQTDAAINQGNSGGALVNLDGEVIGINSWIASQSGGSIGLGFAIPINNAKKAINDFILKGDTQYGWLGVSMGAPSKETKEVMKLKTDGAFIYGIYKGSPAMDSGLQTGDMIIKVGSTKITNGADLSRAVLNLDPGRSYAFKIVRDGREKTVMISIGSRSKADLENGLWPGFSVVPLTEEIRNQYDIPKNVGNLIIAEVDRNSTARIAGLRSGDVIKSIGNKTVKDIGDFYKAINSSGRVSLTIYREGRKFTLDLEP